MSSVTVKSQVDEVTLLKLAREIAMDIHPIEDILEHRGLSPADYQQIVENQHFQQLLVSEQAAWNSAVNTHERVKLKAAGLVEMWLEEANARLHDKTEALNSKVALAQLIARLGEMGLNKAESSGSGERFSFTINLGADAQLKFEKQLPPQVTPLIDVTPTES